MSGKFIEMNTPAHYAREEDRVGWQSRVQCMDRATLSLACTWHCFDFSDCTQVQGDTT